MISIDPGTKQMGWAYWEDGKLKACGIAQGKDWLATLRDLPDIVVDKVCVEDQQIYRSSPIDAHSLLAVARVVGGIAILYNPKTLKLIKPRQWKGQLPKAICNKRTINKLSEEEKGILNNGGYKKSVLHNLYDAVGIGLWELGRR